MYNFGVIAAFGKEVASAFALLQDVIINRLPEVGIPSIPPAPSFNMPSYPSQLDPSQFLTEYVERPVADFVHRAAQEVDGVAMMVGDQLNNYYNDVASSIDGLSMRLYTDYNPPAVDLQLVCERV